ncbi:MAG: hypothetical protein E7Z91_01300 [Cyanobacteria bacterium SIG30]|nr:hypothetical protein [Cyanobacteria bacterium SIG30]
MKILFIIDDLELKYFEFNKLVTNFWLIVEFLKRGYEVSITINRNLYLRENKPYASCFETYFDGNELFKRDSLSEKCLDDFKLILFRPDPPVDLDYINASYVLDFIDKNKTLCLNSSSSIRNKNEKLYVNEFPDLAPKNIVTASKRLIKEFLFQHNEIIIKPLNRCFSSGVFYLNKNDKNINTIIDTATEKEKTTVMVQEFLPQIEKGDKRLIYVCGEILPYCVVKKATNNDFKFNEHTKENLLKGYLTDKEREFAPVLSKKLNEDGVFLAGLDVIEDKIIEINITSPCFFINEINNLFNISLEKIIVNKLEARFNNIFNKKEMFL